MLLLAKSLAVLAALLLNSSVFAHPGHDVSGEVAQRATYISTAEKRSLSHCSAKLKERGFQDRSIARRHELVQALRKKRSLEVRDFRTALNTSHHSTEKYTAQTDPGVIFAGNRSCILSPEVTEGPYYVSGELVRQNVVEKEKGVPLTFEVQVINIKTCEPMKGVLLEMWHCNSTGVYGGISGGNAAGVSDDRELNNTMLRGIQPSKKDGVLLFDTIFPGHYVGRTPHIHVMAHLNATILPNNTVSGGTVSHVGQLFFDQSLISAVEATAPYKTNTQPLTTNEQDFIMAQEAETGDPILEYTLLGSKIEEGLFGWIAFGVDPTANRTVNAAASFGKDGGKANPNPFGPGGPMPSGGFPGGFPSGMPFPPGFTGFPSGFQPPSGFPVPTSFPQPSVSSVAKSKTTGM
ncbi:extracellular dioxygenase-like protein [Lindgomyces ingoldianus]|uniref:Extracellular dioxygenase-like protein n=1 Tax=Lindgomyces ingoldianus TaxID=673940 RepID=A0ACB6R605_9PLEO|nr:extracellular dioxygenase-like protein [Lindgomyces ingoldianus]KAF2473737.1 extracellular dioxygenase-like protein [Lindgomyces ingoldianus]